MADLRNRGPLGRQGPAHRPRTARTVVGSQAQERTADEAHRRWLAGELIPDRITSSLDLRMLDGPEVDEQCGAHEPEVDLWEAGKLYPSWSQVEALARLVDFPLIYFVTPPRCPPIRYEDTSLVFHMDGPAPVRPPGLAGQLDLFAEPEPDGPVLRFTRAALAEAVNRYGIRPSAELRPVGDR